VIAHAIANVIAHARREPARRSCRRAARRAAPALAATVLAAGTGGAAAAQQPPDAARPDSTAVARRVDSLVAAFRAASGAPGVAVAVARAGDTVPLVVAAGVADLDHQVPVRPETVFQLGSVTKQVTAAVVLQLVEAGRVRLDDAIGDHLPALPAAWRTVTVRQLLNHTSGIPSYTDAGERWTRRWAAALPPDSLVALTAGDAMLAAPGARWRYNNTGYVLLGMLVERLTGQPWAEAVAARVTRALGLPSLRACDPGAVVPHRARGYDAAPAVAGADAAPPAGVVPAPYLSMSHAYAAGGLCATAADLARWGRALLAGRVLPPAAFARMAAPEGAAGPWRYGYGLAVDSLRGYPLLYHGGDIPGFTAADVLLPRDGIAIAVVANRGRVDAEGLARDVARAVLGLPADAAPTPAPLAADDRDRAAGRYELAMPGAPMAFALVARGAQLALQPDGGPQLPLVPFGRRAPVRGGYTLTFGAGLDARFRLMLDVRGGRVVGGRVAQGGGVFDVRRLAAAPRERP
jgi:CubicO group peptidase (beta-lactamase class C family)